MKKIILSSLIFIMLMVSLIGTACAASLGTIQFVAINNTDSKVVENLEEMQNKENYIENKTKAAALR